MGKNKQKIFQGVFGEKQPVIKNKNKKNKKHAVHLSHSNFVVMLENSFLLFPPLDSRNAHDGYSGPTRHQQKDKKISHTKMKMTKPCAARRDERESSS